MFQFLMYLRKRMRNYKHARVHNYNHGLLDDENLIKFNNLDSNFYDNNLSSYAHFIANEIHFNHLFT